MAIDSAQVRAALDSQLISWQVSAMGNMANLDVKICGLKTPEAVHAALDGGASHIGFIFFTKSPRNIEPQKAAVLRKIARNRASTVAVSVDATNDTLDKIVEMVEPDMLQLHGSESIERIGEIKRRFKLPVMKAIAIREATDLEKAMPYQDVVERLLFDAKPPKGADLPGGNGVSFDWSLLADFTAEIPVMLSGGLGRDNIVEAVRIARPDGVDISSGVETSPGVKDIALIEDFMGELSRISRVK